MLNLINLTQARNNLSKLIDEVFTRKKTYILKFRKDHLNGKDRSNTNEYIAYKLIEHFKLKIAPQKLKLIEIDDLAITLAEQSSISKESLTYFKASKGTNIAIEFLACNIRAFAIQ